MKSLPLSTSNGVTLVGGGPVTGRDLALAQKRAATLVAADGGADRLLEARLMPDAVIGDFDSVSDETLAQIPKSRQHHIPEQLTTDFDKALRHIDAPFVIALGFVGARVDHGLAALNTLVRHWDRNCILLGPKDVTIALPARRLEIAVRQGDVVSLFPMTAISGAAEGLKWPIAGLDFAPDGFVGTSNEASADQLSFEFKQPGMLLTLPRSRIDAVITALKSIPKRGHEKG